MLGRRIPPRQSKEKNPKSLHRCFALLTGTYVEQGTHERRYTELSSSIKEMLASMKEGFRRVDERFAAQDKRFEALQKQMDRTLFRPGTSLR
ncbi:MAG: hypothetical protein U5P10_12935 [Spirochaetia bacterium]|nr:hypothetical protein [Spirochaetia bacterium]